MKRRLPQCRLRLHLARAKFRPFPAWKPGKMAQPEGLRDLESNLGRRRRSLSSVYRAAPTEHKINAGRWLRIA
jgi:hypothetical protein